MDQVIKQFNIEEKGKNNFLDCVQLGCDYTYSRW